MRVALISSRTFDDLDLMRRTLIANVPDSSLSNVVVVTGGAKGADQLAETLASELNLEVDVIKADWKKYGRGAGPVRNNQIIETSDLVIAFWDGLSRGTADSIKKAQIRNTACIVVNFK